MNEAVRLDILQAVEDGQISAREAIRLLDALDGRTAGAQIRLRVRIIESDTQRARVDAVLPVTFLEGLATLGVHPDALWGLKGEIDARAVLSAIETGARGVVASAEDEARGRRVELVVDEG